MFDASRPFDTPSHALALVAAAFAVLLSARLQALAWQLRSEEARSRLASNLRDLVNLVAVLVMSAAFLLAGMSFPLAFLAAGTVVIAEETLRHAQGRATSLPMKLGFLLALPAAAFPEQVAHGATWAAHLIGA